MSETSSRRPPAPKPENYVVVAGSRGSRRDFRISVGLREGWDAEGRVFDISEAVRTARVWMKRRVEAGRPALSGMFTRAEVTYAWPRPDGTVGSDREPVALFTGEAVHAYLGHLPDVEIEAMLNELAIELGVALGQERIYVAFTDRVLVTLAVLRLQIPHAALAQLYGVHRSTVTRSVREVRPLLAGRGYATAQGRRLSTLADVFAYAAAHGITLRLDGSEIQVRRPPAGRPGRRAFVSGKKKANTIKFTKVCDERGRTLWDGAFRPGRMHDQTALQTDGIIERVFV